MLKFDGPTSMVTLQNCELFITIGQELTESESIFKVCSYK